MPIAPDAAPRHRTQNWHVRKPAARGRAGMVASQVGAAAEAGEQAGGARGHAEVLQGRPVAATPGGVSRPGPDEGEQGDQ